MKLPRLAVAGSWFVEPSGRRVLLRGVNLGGDCKVPYPDGGSYRATDFADHRQVSFVGRPFPSSEADAHLGRLRHWGFNVVRLLTTWEAVEHEGPGLYDEAYLDYIAEVSRRAGDHGLYVFVDFHQDAWSRMSGGDGAPGWTFEAMGLDFAKLRRAGAALVMNYEYDLARGGRQEDRYPQMSWGWNYRMPGNAIPWTLFFGGNAFAPGHRIEGEPAQDWLQARYLGAMRAVAERMKDQDHVLGFDTLNEPSLGWIGRKLSERVGPPQRGPAWSPLDGIKVAGGESRRIPFLAPDPATGRMAVVREDEVNPDRVRLWRPGIDDPFAGVEREDHFTHDPQGRAYDAERDFLVPFFRRVAETIRSVRSDWLVFAEMDPFKAFAGETFPEGTPERTVNASHWYDLVTLVTKRFDYPVKTNPWTGKTLEGDEAIRASYVKQLRRFREMGDRMAGGGAPTLIGEFGIPFDLDEGAAYAAWADGDRSPGPWAKHVKALELMYDAMDALLLHSTQWNYTASNRNDAAIGDRWNQEDLSIWSADQQDDARDPDSGGRAVDGFCRPFVRVWAGEPVAMRFDAATLVLEAELLADPNLGATEIYVPARRFAHGLAIGAEGASIAADPQAQIVRVTARAAGRLSIRIAPRRA